MMKNITRRGFFGFVQAALAGVVAARLPKVNNMEPVTFEVADLAFADIKCAPDGQDLIFSCDGKETFCIDSNYTMGSETPKTLLHIAVKDGE